jgi:uncharacterized protein YjbI with pentapeptide repeats
VRPPDVPADDDDDVEVYDIDGELEDEARVEGTQVTGSWMGETLSGVELVRSRMSGVRLTGATLERLLLRDVVAVDCELSGATLTGAVMERVRFERCRMSGLVASELRAHDVTMVDCQLDEAWLRASTFERCELTGCDLREADLYRARLHDVRFLGCRLDGSEWSDTTNEKVALHGSSVDGIKGLGAPAGLVISGDQIVALAGPLLTRLGVVVDDDYFDDPEARAKAEG